MRVFLVDEHEVVRRGVISIIRSADDLEVVGEAGTVAGALLRVKAARPDITILGVDYQLGDGVDLCRKLLNHAPTMACLMLTTTADDKVLLAAFLAGASGVVDKRISAEDLIAAVRTVGSGRSLLDHRAAATILERLQTRPEPYGPFADLTIQERMTLNLIGEGLTNRQIAARMFVAEKTVKNYVSRVLAKLGLSSRQQAAIAITEDRHAHPD